MLKEQDVAARVTRLAKLGRARDFSREQFEKELRASTDGLRTGELLRLLLIEWTGVTLEPEEAEREFRRVLKILETFQGTLGRPVSLQTALLHEFHSRRGLLAEPRLLSENDISALRFNAITDPLTGLYNRRFLLDHLDREVARAERTGGVVSVLMMDLTGFKGINDRLGHPVGDSILARTAAAIRASLRAVDAGCRYGGDEFVAVLPNTDILHSLRVAERIRRRVSTIRLPRQVGLRVGLSYGVSSFPTDGRLLDFLLKVSDIRLYRSKQQQGGEFDRARRYPRFDVPGLTLRLPGSRSHRSETAEVRDISYGGLAFLSTDKHPPSFVQGEIRQRHSSETHRVEMRAVSTLPMPDGRVRVGCAYVQ
ncbi:MAG: GGDEF domain-containing protein [Thermoanaerobaculia bacterium]